MHEAAAHDVNAGEKKEKEKGACVEVRKECICVNGGGGHTGQEMPVQMEE